MKRITLNLLACSLYLVSCTVNAPEEEFSTRWNGYGQYLKTGEMVHTLWAGKHIPVGTVTYGLDENANFYAKYDCSTSGWKISETHLFAGDKALMPLNKPGRPKIGLFPYSGSHSPRVSTFIYRVPLLQLPPCAAPGFVVAAHCVVHSPAGQSESAWAEGSYTFSDKGWGWYDTYYYDPPVPPLPVLYGTTCSNDTLRLYHVDITTQVAELMVVEYVGNTAGSYDGAAYDPEAGIFYYAKVNTGELWVNRIQEEDPSFCAGLLDGIARSGTCHCGCYYYVDDALRTIREVSFTDQHMIADEAVLDTIPVQVSVSDVAMQPGGELLYIMATNTNGNAELISWDVAERTFRRKTVDVPPGAQITFGSDGRLYAVASMFDQDSTSFIYIIDQESDSLEVVMDEIVWIDDPFSDLSGGPDL